MADPISSLQADILAECAELGRQSDEENRIGLDVGKSIAELLAIGLSRQDTETINAAAAESIAMIKIDSDGRDTVEDILAKLGEAQTVEFANPNDYRAALSEIVEIAKRARSLRTAAIEELKRMQLRVNELLDSAKPKA